MAVMHQRWEMAKIRGRIEWQAGKLHTIQAPGSYYLRRLTPCLPRGQSRPLCLGHHCWIWLRGFSRNGIQKRNIAGASKWINLVQQAENALIVWDSIAIHLYGMPKQPLPTPAHQTSYKHLKSPCAIPQPAEISLVCGRVLTTMGASPGHGQEMRRALV